MGDENPIRTLGDYSKPRRRGYRNTTKIPEGNNVVSLRSDTIRNGDGIGGGDGHADGVVHLARRSPAESGDSEVSGDGSGVGTARSLLTSASSGKDMEA
nr:hypothetical protein [Tanacetum cinerariifolium]